MVENPAAFPCTGEGFSSPQYTQHGMTLRDYFAGQALAGLAANAQAMFGGHYQGDPDAIAMLAVRFADAMLAARQEPSA